VAVARLADATTGPIGGHAAVAGGLVKAGLSYVDNCKAGAVQVYLSNPRGWAVNPADPAQDELFLTGCEERDVVSFVHATLLVNVGSPSPQTVKYSIGALDHAIRRGRAIGARGVVFHAGNAVDPSRADAAMRQVREALLPLLDTAAANGGPRLLVEPSAGGGRALAARVEDLAEYLDAVDNHPWLGVCFDTCHARSWQIGRASCRERV